MTTPYIKLSAVLLMICCVLTACSTANDTPGPGTSDGFDELIEAVDSSGNLDLTITATIIDSTHTDKLSTVATGSVTPVVLEVDAATPKGKPFKAVLLGSSQEALAAGFSGELRVRAKRTEVNGQAVLAGYARFTEQNSAGPFAGFAFLATKENVDLIGPELGSIYNLDGTATARALCNNENIFGAALFKNRLETVRVVNAFLATQNDYLACDGGRDVATEVQMNIEAEVIETHLGKLLSSYGSMRFRRTEESYTLPVFALGVAETLSERIQQERFEADIASNVLTLEPFAMSELLAVRQGVIYFRNLPTSLANLQAGDIVVSRPFGRFPQGFVRRVSSIEPHPQGIAVTTEVADLSQVFVEGGFEFRRVLSAEDLIADVVAVEGVDVSAFNDLEALRAQALSSQAIDLLPRININKEIVDGLFLEGFVDLGIEPVFEFKCRKAFCGELKVVGKFIVTEEAELALVGNAALDFNKTIPLAPDIPLGTFVIYAGVPITVTPVISFNATISASGEIDLEVVASQSFELEIGVEKPYGEGFGPVKSFSQESDFSVDVSGSVEAEARAAVKASITVLGTLSAYADLGPYIEFEAQYPGDPLWELRGGLNSYAGLEYDLLVISDDIQFEIFDRNYTIATSPNNAPEITSLAIDGPTVISSGSISYRLDGLISAEASVFDAEVGEDCCEIFWLVVGPPGSGQNEGAETTAGNHSFSFTPQTEGDYQLTVRVSDAQGLVGEVIERTLSVAEFDISVVDLPQLSLEKLTVGNVYPAGLVEFEATVSDENDPSCCELSWYLDGVFQQTSSGSVHSFNARSLVTGVHSVEVRLANEDVTLGFISRSAIFVVQREPINPPEIRDISLDFEGINLNVGEAVAIIFSVVDDTDGCCEVSAEHVRQFGGNVSLDFNPSFNNPYLSVYTFDTAGEQELLITAIDAEGNSSEATVLVNVVDDDGFAGVFP